MAATDILRILIRADGSQAQNEFQRVGVTMQRVGAGLTTGVTAPLVALGVASVRAASNLEEAANKVDVVFGSAAGTVRDFATTTSTAFGISERAALEAAGTLGNLVVSMGGSQEAASAMSVDLVELAGDLSSFNNIGTAEVLEKIRSGLVGEVEPLRALGVSLDAATVNQRALAIAVEDGRAAFTAADQVLARYLIIVEQTGTAQGDFARTSDSLANQQRVVQAQMEESAAAIGQHLLPVARDLLGGIADLTEWFGNLSPQMQGVIVKVGIFAAAIGPAVLIAGSFVRALGSMRVAALALGSGGGAALGVAAIGVGLLVYQMAQAAQRAAEFEAAVDSLREAMGGGFAATVEHLANTLVDDFSVTLLRLGLSAEEVARALLVGDEAVLKLSESVNEAVVITSGMAEGMQIGGRLLFDVFDELGPVIEAARTELSLFEETTEATATTVGETRSKLLQLSFANDFVGRSADSAATKIGRLMAAQAELAGVAISAAEAQLRVHDSIDGVSDALDENERTLDGNTEAGQANQRSLLESASAWIALAEAQREEDGDARRAADTWNYGREVLIGQAEQFGLTRQQAEEYVNGLGLIPAELHTSVLLDVSDAERDLTHFLRDRLLKVGIHIGAAGDIFGGGSGAGPQPRALGGPVSAGHPYMVGERGPELFVPSMSGSIVPNGGGGATYITINMPAGSNGDSVVAALQRYQRRSGTPAVTG